MWRVFLSRNIETQRSRPRAVATLAPLLLLLVRTLETHRGGGGRAGSGQGGDLGVFAETLPPSRAAHTLGTTSVRCFVIIIVGVVSTILHGGGTRDDTASDPGTARAGAADNGNGGGAVNLSGTAEASYRC
jgi:hypothetical protein